jgi:glycosyltransferase involved in cell wall biosynthesis
MKAFSLFKNSKMIVFESQEYRDLILSMNYKIQKKAFIIEDTPQNEFCCINYQTRRNQVIWLGTNHTSKFLKDYFHYFHYFNDLNYQICFLGIDIDTEKFFKLRKIRAEYFNSYDRTLMEDKLLSSKVSFVPYSNVDIFKYRGNLKTKLSMAYGCVVIASNLDMHKRLINNGVNGYLYDNFNDFKQIRHTTSIFEKVSKNANNLIISQYTRSNHAQQILDLYEKSSNVE